MTTTALEYVITTLQRALDEALDAGDASVVVRADVAYGLIVLLQQIRYSLRWLQLSMLLASLALGIQAARGIGWMS